VGQYTGNAGNFSDSIYYFEPIDQVLGGLTGPSNRPVKMLADNTAYLKKFKGNLIRGNGAPSDAVLTGYSIDANTNNNTIYLDEVTGAFWKRTGTNTWQNTYAGATLNVKEVKFNNNGIDSQYVFLRYNATSNQLELRNSADTAYADLRVGTLIFDSADTEGGTISKFIDKEIIILNNITDASENQDGFFSVKLLIDETLATVTSFEVKGLNGHTNDKFYYSGSLTTPISAGDYIQIKGIPELASEKINGFYKVDSVGVGYIITNNIFKSLNSQTEKTGLTGSVSKDNSAQLRWDNAHDRWELRKRDGTLLPLNVSGLLINGVAVSFIADRVISTTVQFDEIFNHHQHTGSNRCYLRTPEDNYNTHIFGEYIVIKRNTNTPDGAYTLNSLVIIEGSDNYISFMPGVVLRYANATCGFKFQNETNLVVDRIDTNLRKFEVLSENFYKVDGEHIGDIPIIRQSDTNYVFSQNPDINKKYYISQHNKNIKDLLIADHSLAIPMTDPNAWDTIYYTEGNRIIVVVAYLDLSNIKIAKYYLNESSGSLTSIGTHVLANSDSSFSNVKLYQNTLNVVAVGYTSSANTIKYVFDTKASLFTSPISPVNIRSIASQADSATFSCIFEDGDMLYIFGVKTATDTLRYYAGNISSYSSLSVYINNVDSGIDVDNLQIPFVKNGNTVLAAYCSGVSALNGFIVAKYDTTHSPVPGSWTKSVIDVASGSGKSSALCIAPDPQNPSSNLVHVSYTSPLSYDDAAIIYNSMLITYDNTALTTNTSIKYGYLNSTYTALVYNSILSTDIYSDYKQILFKYVSENKFIGNGMLQIVAKNNVANAVTNPFVNASSDSGTNKITVESAINTILHQDDVVYFDKQIDGHPIGKHYYVINVDIGTDTFQVSSSKGGVINSLSTVTTISVFKVSHDNAQYCAPNAWNTFPTWTESKFFTGTIDNRLSKSTNNYLLDIYLKNNSIYTRKLLYTQELYVQQSINVVSWNIASTYGAGIFVAYNNQQYRSRSNVTPNLSKQPDVEHAFWENVSMVISNDYIENTELEIGIFDAQNHGQETGYNQSIIDVSNTINSKITRMQIKNSNFLYGILANNKTFNFYLQNIWIDELNTQGTNFGAINHCSLVGINIKNTGLKNFDSCFNLNIIGIVDGVAVIQSGNFNI
jgi:hypothetical protein